MKWNVIRDLTGLDHDGQGTFLAVFVVNCVLLGRGEDHVFTTPEGLPVHRAVLYQSFKRLCKREGLPDITFHQLGYTCATLLAQRNVHPNTVKAIMGHADIRTALGTYSHEWPSQQKDAAEGFADVIFCDVGSNRVQNAPSRAPDHGQ